jgi:hypothetical protein
MSKQQQLELIATLRQGQLDLGADVATLRVAFNDVMARAFQSPAMSITFPRRSAA